MAAPVKYNTPRPFCAIAFPASASFFKRKNFSSAVGSFFGAGGIISLANLDFSSGVNSFVRTAGNSVSSVISLPNANTLD